MKPLIVIPAWRRPVALQRLLESLNCAVYPPGGVELLISLDGGADEGSREVAEAFRFKGGKVRVYRQKGRLGLREHILWCGDRTEEHDAVIVLEEDLMVAPDFYRFAVAALDHYDGEEAIGGIALYAYEFNEFAGLPFVPLSGRHDAYFMAAGCSSGQAWSRRHWSKFRSWMAVADPDEIDRDPGLPAKLRSWPESSWKKYYGAWLARTGRYMVYPYQSMTTNCSDPGGKNVTWYFSDYQVRMPLDDNEGWEERPAFRFPAVGLRAVSRSSSRPDSDSDSQPGSGSGSDSRPGSGSGSGPHPTDSPVCYDAFMEPCGTYIRDQAGVPVDDLSVEMSGGTSEFDPPDTGQVESNPAQKKAVEEARSGSEDPSGGKKQVTLEVDFHGIKAKERLDRAEWCLTVRPSRNPVRHYPLHYRPLEQNMAHPVSPEEGFFVLTRPEDITLHTISARTRYRLTRYYMRGHPEKPAFLKGYLLSVVRRLIHRIFGR